MGIKDTIWECSEDGLYTPTEECYCTCDWFESGLHIGNFYAVIFNPSDNTFTPVAMVNRRSNYSLLVDFVHNKTNDNAHIVYDIQSWNELLRYYDLVS